MTKMRKSRCVYCEPCVFIEDGTRGYHCRLDEEDMAEACRPGFCHYYRRPGKTLRASSLVAFAVPKARRTKR